MSTSFSDAYAFPATVRPQAPMIRDVSFLVPVAVLIVALVVVQLSNLDHRLADFIYTMEGGHWDLRYTWWTSEVLHKAAQKFSILIGVITLGTAIASNFSARLKPYRRGLFATFFAAIISLLLVSLSKHELPLACPWDMQRYGGELAGHAVFNFYWGQDVGGCFPAGHAAGGYCLIVWFFFARHYRFRHYRLALLPGIVLGLIYGINQELRGAHFLSHDLAAMLLCWTVGYLVFRLIMGNLTLTGPTRSS